MNEKHEIKKKGKPSIEENTTGLVKRFNQQNKVSQKRPEARF